MACSPRPAWRTPAPLASCCCRLFLSTSRVRRLNFVKVCPALYSVPLRVVMCLRSVKILIDPTLQAGALTLRLQPRALEYLASRLQILEELKILRQTSPVDFFRGAFTDLDDYTRLQRLQQGLQRVQSVRVQSIGSHLRCGQQQIWHAIVFILWFFISSQMSYSMLQVYAAYLLQGWDLPFHDCAVLIRFQFRDPTRVNLLPFYSMTKLELIDCDLSTSAWIGVHNMQVIQSLNCSGCLEELHHLLFPFSHLISMPGIPCATQCLKMPLLVSCPWSTHPKYAIKCDWD